MNYKYTNRSVILNNSLLRVTQGNGCDQLLNPLRGRKYKIAKNLLHVPDIDIHISVLLPEFLESGLGILRFLTYTKPATKKLFLSNFQFLCFTRGYHKLFNSWYDLNVLPKMLVQMDGSSSWDLPIVQMSAMAN